VNNSLSIAWRAALWLCLASGAVWADDLAQAPSTLSAHAVVEDATNRVMAVLEEAPAYVEEDPARYYDAVHAILDPVIDYRGFARGVMGPYATSERYRSLDEAGRAQLRGQLDRFTETMRNSLIRTYGKGLLAFGGSRVMVNGPQDDGSESGVVSVEQLIFSEEAQPYVVLYQMGRDRDGQWKLRNVIIEAINLGQVYRNQFEAAARKYEGDLDAVIDNWTAPDTEREGEA
jgi:phospholipid transport system substrate-binding protein